MASKKITELTELSWDEIFDEDAYLPIVKDGTTYKIKLKNILIKTLRIDKSSEMSTVDAKAISSNNDIIMLEDSAHSNEKKSCTKAQFLHDVPQVQTGNGAPGFTPGKRGMVYIDIDSNDVYIAANYSASSDWKLINI